MHSCMVTEAKVLHDVPGRGHAGDDIEKPRDPSTRSWEAPFICTGNYLASLKMRHDQDIGFP